MSTTASNAGDTAIKDRLKPTRSQAGFAFSVLLVINILNYADRYVLPAILPKIADPKQGLGLTPFQQGLLGSSFLIVYALATLPLGVWADRGVRKNIVALCVGIWSVATTLAGITRSFAQLFSVRAVLGIGEAGYAPASLSLLGDFFPKSQRGRILSYWSAGTLIGAAIGFTLGGLIADTLGWRYAFFVVGVPGLIAAFLSWRMVEPVKGISDMNDVIVESEGTPVIEHGNIGKGFWKTAGALRGIPTYWVLVGALVFSFFTIGGTSFWLPSYIVDSFRLSVGQAGLASGAVLVASGLIGTVVGGWLADFAQRRRPEGRLLIATLGLLIGAPLVLGALLLHTLALFIAVFVLAAIALNFCTGPLNAVIQDVIAPEMRATALGLSLLLAHLLGDAAAPTVIGAIANGTSLGTALTLTAPTFLFLAGLVCLLGLRTVARDMRRMQQQLLTGK
ncbi:MAG TPA: MFS transporter [Ktedonobacteraceae bacterium]|nr:MFS transporter [Ktedonobacteraceae bacterium]